MKNDPQWDKFKSNVATENTVASADEQQQYKIVPDKLTSNQREPEVSADAKYIARRIIAHLWILLFVMPVLAALCYAVLVATGDIK